MSKNGKKGSHGLRNFMVFIVVIAGAIIGCIFYFRGNIPEQVKYVDGDVISFYEKVNIEQENYTFDMMDLLTGNVIATGSVDVDTVFTSEELTAFLQGHSRDEVSFGETLLILGKINNMFLTSAYATSYSGTTAFTDFNARILGEDELELFANVSEDINEIYNLIPGLDNYAFIVDRAAGANLHFVLGLTYSKDSGFNVLVKELYVKGVPVPQGLVNEYEPQLTNLLNRALQNEEVFAIDVFKIESDEIIFKGRVPEYLERIN
jgi:hypothetical protein